MQQKNLNKLKPKSMQFKNNFFIYKIWFKTNFYEDAYIIGHYYPSVRIIDLVSHTSDVVCVNFIHKWRDLQFKVDLEHQIF